MSDSRNLNDNPNSQYDPTIHYPPLCLVHEKVLTGLTLRARSNRVLSKKFNIPGTGQTLQRYLGKLDTSIDELYDMKDIDQAKKLFREKYEALYGDIKGISSHFSSEMGKEEFIKKYGSLILKYEWTTTSLSGRLGLHPTTGTSYLIKIFGTIKIGKIRSTIIEYQKNNLSIAQIDSSSLKEEIVTNYGEEEFNYNENNNINGNNDDNFVALGRFNEKEENSHLFLEQEFVDPEQFTENYYFVDSNINNENSNYDPYFSTLFSEQDFIDPNQLKSDNFFIDNTTNDFDFFSEGEEFNIARWLPSNNSEEPKSEESKKDRFENIQKNEKNNEIEPSNHLFTKNSSRDGINRKRKIGNNYSDDEDHSPRKKSKNNEMTHQSISFPGLGISCTHWNRFFSNSSHSNQPVISGPSLPESGVPPLTRKKKN